MDLLRKLAIEHDAAIIAVTHDEKIFDRFDHIFQLRDGRLEGNGDGQNGTMEMAQA
jgi:putative ABC transport system ATP-binding protein